MDDPYKYCHDGWPGITDQPGYKPVNTPEELKKANEEFALKHRPIHPEIHKKEDRKFFNLPPCTCHFCDWCGEPISHTEPPENY